MSTQFLTNEQYAKANAEKMHKEQAKKLGISENDLWLRKQQLHAAWESSGGTAGALARLAVANKFLEKSKTE